MVIRNIKIKQKQRGERERERSEWALTKIEGSSLGDNIESIKYPRDIAKNGQQQTNPKLDLN